MRPKEPFVINNPLTKMVAKNKKENVIKFIIILPFYKIQQIFWNYYLFFILINRCLSNHDRRTDEPTGAFSSQNRYYTWSIDLLNNIVGRI